MNILAGLAKGLNLQTSSTPKGRARHGLGVPATELRPSPVRMRKAMADSLKPVYVGSKIVDLFAGCGSMGLEFASRGAAEVTFVESTATTGLAENIEGFFHRQDSQDIPRMPLKWVSQPVNDFLNQNPQIWLDASLIWMDPPYENTIEYLKSAVLILREKSQGSEGALAKILLAVEYESRQRQQLLEAIADLGLEVTRDASYGRAAVVFLKFGPLTDKDDR